MRQLTDHDVIDEMESLGGSFVKALGEAWIKAVGQLGVNLHHELNEMDGEELRELSDGELRIVRNFATIGWSLVIEKMVENQSQAPPTT